MCFIPTDPVLCDMSVSTNGLRLIVQSCIKKKMFRKVKYFYDELHGAWYNTTHDSDFGLVMRFAIVLSSQQDHVGGMT